MKKNAIFITKLYNDEYLLFSWNSWWKLQLFQLETRDFHHLQLVQTSKSM